MIAFKKESLLVIAPHPDDEVLGCAGLIQKIKKLGGSAYVLYLAVGNTKDFSNRGSSTRKDRIKEIQTVAKFLNLNDFDIAQTQAHHLKLDTIGRNKLMNIIERKSSVSLQKIKPSIVAFPSQYSYNQDHAAVSFATHSALRPAETDNKHYVPTVLAYEVPADSWSMHHQVVPNVFVPLTQAEIRGKTHAMELYSSQMRPWPNPRSLPAIESLAKLRGAHASCQFAEGYIGYRIIV